MNLTNFISKFLKQIIWLIFFNFLIIKSIVGQDPNYSNIYPNRILFNPSFISFSDVPKAFLFYRNQWPYLSSAFVNYGVAYIHPVNNLSSSFGMLFTNDVQGKGIIAKTSISGIYSYSIQLNKNSYMYSGLQIAYNLRKINLNDVTFESDISGTPSVYEVSNSKSSFFDFSLGCALNLNKQYKVGVSVFHITSPIQNSNQNTASTLNIKYTFFASTLIQLSYPSIPEKSIEPGLLLNIQNVNKELVIGSNMSISSITFGIWLRNNLNFSIKNIIFTLGLSLQKFDIYYAYDVNTIGSKNFLPGMGAHEVTFLLDFQYKEKIKDLRQ